MNDEIIVSELETKLNILAEEYELDNQFVGEVGYYDHDWLTKHINSLVIPFVLTNIGFTKEPTVYGRYNGRYALAFLVQSKHRDTVYNLMRKFVDDLTEFDFVDDDKKYITMPTSYDMGVDFEGGDGIGDYFFEVLINLTITQSHDMLNGKDRVITFNDIEIPHKSIKFEHGKLDLANVDNDINGYTDEINKFTNNSSIIIEAFMTKSSTILQDFLLLNKTSQSSTLKISFGDYEVVNDTFTYDGHMIANRDDEDVKIFLYFSKTEKKTVIKVYNQENEAFTIPVVSYTIGNGSITEPHTKPNTNEATNLFYGRLRNYAFVISEDFSNDNEEIFDFLFEQLLGDEAGIPLISVGIQLNNRPEKIKTLMITDIQKSSKDGGRSFITINFVDGSDL